MTMKRFRDLLFKDKPGDEVGKRAEIIITLGLGFIVTGAWVFSYANPVVVALSAATSLTALFSLVQIAREKPAYPLVFPALVMGCVTAISVLEGAGVHDLIWMSSLGVYLLVNIISEKNAEPILLVFGFTILAVFVGVGLFESSGILPNPLDTDLRYVFLNTGLLIGLMGAMTAVFHRHRVLLRFAKEKQVEDLLSSERLEEFNRRLEKQALERTEALVRSNDKLATQASKLQAATEISQELIAAAQESVTDILARAARLVSDKLGYYHVGIFLLDANRGYAVLHAANSKGGQQMLANRHQLKVGGTGIVGYVAQSGRPRIALDTGADAVFFNNPYLPDTRSEISLPIKAANSVLGVLDVQSAQPAAFGEEDTSILLSIANQIALILLQTESREAFDATQRGVRRAALATVNDIIGGYKYLSDGTISVNFPEEINPAMKKAASTGEIVTVSRAAHEGKSLLYAPVKFRDQVIGVIQIEAEEGERTWSEDEILLVQAISDRAGLALENARLFEDATRRAEQEEAISQVTAQIGSSTDFERILQTTVHELGVALGASRSFIQLGSAPSIIGEDGQ
jgi:GAF domain-containing protein